MSTENEVDVAVIGSGFGGSVAALRFAQAGQRVVVLERGARVSREKFEADLDALWNPARASYGFHDLKFRGPTLLPWLGAAVGGGSHVYAGTLKRRDSFDGFPAAIRAADMARYYDAAESMLEGTPFPDYPPYSRVRSTRLMLRAAARLQKKEPELVEGFGPAHLGVSFAPKGGKPGTEFVNKHGAKQRYYDPREQSLLGGDIDAKNTLDRNYLFLAEKAGASIRELCEADRIARLPDGRWEVTYRRHLPSSGWEQFVQRWLTRNPAPRMSEPETLVARRLVIGCGSLGSTELLLRNRDVHRTLPSLGPALGTRYNTNGDYLSGIFPFRLLIPVWLAFAALVGGLALGQWWLAGIAGAAYYLGLALSGRPYDPDIGTTNSDYLRVRGPKGESQYGYIEGGRYPVPDRALLAILITVVTGKFRPTAYRLVSKISDFLRFWIPPFGALAHSYPIPLLQMGRDRAVGTIRLDAQQRAVIDYDLDQNRDFYAYLDSVGRKVAREVGAFFARNPTLVWMKKQEVPHNQGGVPMADSPDEGVVDHAGRVFGEPDLMVLDGSIIPVSVGPNPALTILAVAERAMEIVVAQLKDGGAIVAEQQEQARQAG